MRGLPELGSDLMENQVSATENQIVAEAKDTPTVLCEPSVTYVIFGTSLRSNMRCAIEFYDEPGFDAGEIGHVWADRDLSPELCADAAATKTTPEHRLGLRHLAAQLAG